MIAGVYISQEMFANGILTALKPSLEHDGKHVLRLLRLYGDPASIYSNFKLVYTRRYAAFSVKNNTPLCGKSYGYPHHQSRLGRMLSLRTKAARRRGFFGTSSKSREEIENFQHE